MLNDLNILVVEDEALLAMELSMTLEDQGADIVGPCGSVASALTRCGTADVAVLDVDLCGEKVYPVADRLMREGKPFVFHTGRGDVSALRARYGEDVMILSKPSNVDAIGPLLAQMLGRA